MREDQGDKGTRNTHDRQNKIPDYVKGLLDGFSVLVHHLPWMSTGHLLDDMNGCQGAIVNASCSGFLVVC